MKPLAGGATSPSSATRGAGSSGAPVPAARSSSDASTAVASALPAGVTPSEALEAQKRKRLEIEAGSSGLELSGIEEIENLPLDGAIQSFLKDIKTFRKKLTHQKYDHILGLFSEHVAPKSDPGTTLYTDRVILHNFFRKLGIDNPVKDVPRLPKFRKQPIAYSDEELNRFSEK